MTGEHLDRARRAPRGFALYATTLYTVARNPGLSTTQIADTLKRNRQNVMRELLAMRSLRLVKREECRSMGGLTYLWSLGQDDNMLTQYGTRYRPPATLISFAAVLHACGDGATNEDIAARIGSDVNNVRRIVSMLRKPGRRLIRVCRWEVRNGFRPGPPVAVWQFAPGADDAKKPPRKDKVQINRDWREAQKAKRAQLDMLRRIAGNASVFTIAA